jgi:hypothetical protein
MSRFCLRVFVVLVGLYVVLMALARILPGLANRILDAFAPQPAQSAEEFWGTRDLPDSGVLID